MSVLLTGGLGFIGSHTCVDLLENNYQVIIIDNLSNSSIDQLNKLQILTNKSITFYNVDMQNIMDLNKVFIDHQIDSVIHFAGLKSVAESVNQPLFYYSHNLQIMFNLLQVMNLHGCKKLIFSSSATVYGSQSFQPISETAQTGLGITNPYGQTKYFQEEILKDIYKSDPSWNITILRYFNPTGNHPSGIIGENPNGIPNNLFPCIFRSIRERRVLKIYGNTYETTDGTCVRDFIHVVDLANAHVKALNKCNGLNIYNVGLGKGTSVLEIIKTFERVNDIKLNYEMADKRPGDIASVFADNKKILAELNWIPTKTVEDMCNTSQNQLKLI
jgi:UDP-glucose 4-epimerase